MVLSVYTGQFIDGHVQCASGEELKLKVNNVSMKYKNQEMGSNGTLIITTEFVYWVIPSGEMCSGYSIDYPSIALHAICKDTNVNDKPCIYCHLSEGDEQNEMILVPEDESKYIFSIISDCQELHPDADDDGSDELITSENQLPAGSSELLAQWDALLQNQDNTEMEDE